MVARLQSDEDDVDCHVISLRSIPHKDGWASRAVPQSTSTKILKIEKRNGADNLENPNSQRHTCYITDMLRYLNLGWCQVTEIESNRNFMGRIPCSERYDSL